ncbi:alpha-L-fucosidase [Algibacter sp. 2305UL17-15]|uniref:alpha-L-fucosidase n=1 Tax=Algibacter sp. 2305UL17-15 TaxID=3231268 RepID=UPI00345A6EF2
MNNSLKCLFFVLPFWSCQDSKPKYETNTTSYEANWEILAKHTTNPEWFHDSKLGIYFHWGFIVFLLMVLNGTRIDYIV